MKLRDLRQHYNDEKRKIIDKGTCANLIKHGEII